MSRAIFGQLFQHQHWLPFTTLRRPAKSLIVFSPAAEAQLRRLYAGADTRLLRLSLKKKGCSGLSYSLEFAETRSPLDEEVEQNGLKIVVDAKAIMPLLGTEMDYTENELGSQFTFKNPNVKETCGCGLSFSV